MSLYKKEVIGKVIYIHKNKEKIVMFAYVKVRQHERLSQTVVLYDYVQVVISGTTRVYKEI